MKRREHDTNPWRIDTSVRTVGLPVTILTLAILGCATTTPTPTVENAVQRRSASPVASRTDSRNQNSIAQGEPKGRLSTSDEEDPPIARINSRPIDRSHVLDLLVASHGASLLEQVVGLEAAKMHADAKGVRLTNEDIEQEYLRTLQTLTDPLASLTPGSIDRAEAEKLLDTVLRQRNLSRVEFELVVKRNAYLRKAVLTDIKVTEAALRQEYERKYGSRVEIRHIQLPSLREIDRVKSLLEAGDDFASVARRFSANRLSAEDGGALEPFSSADEAVPVLLRQTAFSLSPGERSDSLRVGQWFHIIQVERFLRPHELSFGTVRDQLTDSFRDRLSETAIFELFEKLFRGAKIEIYDPVLRRAFLKRHPEHDVP